MLDLNKFLNDAQTIAVTCAQFGDTGKGKIVDFLTARWAEFVVRGTGGPNCGHTVCCQQGKYVFHLIPSGILYDQAGKLNIIGSGTVVNPWTLYQELMVLEENNLSYDNLRLALNAKLILPSHILLDRIREASATSGKIGTTGQGIGPAYTDHVARQGLIVNDLLNPDIFAAKLKKHLAAARLILKNYDPDLLMDIMYQRSLDHGHYYDKRDILNPDAIILQYTTYGKQLKDLIWDTDTLLQSRVHKSKILLEGAQGLLLSIDHGTYPYVTSSNCSAAGLALGAGLHPQDIDLSLMIIKGGYMTRVGGGPFPTECGGEKSEKWCNGGGGSRERELQEPYQQASVNSADSFTQGIALRQLGDEYGATTGRPRRVGWLDLLLLQEALRHDTQKNLVLTKLDVLDTCQTIKICTAYIYRGPTYSYGQETIKCGDILDRAVMDSQILRYCEPLYQEFPGWLCSLQDCHDFASLPLELKNIIFYITEQTQAKVCIISIGPDRDETILVD